MIHPPWGHQPSEPSPIDATVALLVFGLLLFSLTSVLFILHFHILGSSRSPLHSRRIRDLNSLWAVRVLLIAFACLWALAELLRFPHLIQLLSHRTPSSLRLCHAYILTSHAFFQPCFFVTLLFLLQASLDDSFKDLRRGNAFVSALAVSLATSFPFFAVHVFLLHPTTSWALQKFHILPDILNKIVGSMDVEDDNSVAAMRCAYPLFSTALLATFGAVYVPWFVSVCWRAVTVVINKKLRVRLYALAAAVLLGLLVQVTVLALTVLWKPVEEEFQVLGLVGFLAVFACVLVGEGILVVRPIRDVMEIGCWCAGGGGGEPSAGEQVVAMA